MANELWVTELGLAENDALRQAGDVRGVQTKYGALDGPDIWSDAPQGDFLTIVNQTGSGNWLGELTVPQRNAFLDTHTDASGNVLLSVGATRTALAGFMTAQQTTDITNTYSRQNRLYQTRGLPFIDSYEIAEVFRTFPDSPYYRQTVLQQIDAKTKDRSWRDTTSTANLITIESLIGV